MASFRLRPDSQSARSRQEWRGPTRQKRTCLSLQFVGIEPLTLPHGLSFGDFADGKSFGAFSTPPGQTIVAPETLRDFGVAEGAVVTIDGGKTLPPIRSNLGPPLGLLIVDIRMAQALLNRPGQLSRLILQPQPERTDLEPLATVTGGALRPRPPGEEEGDLRRLTESFHMNLTAFGALACLVGLFIVYAAFGLASNKDWRRCERCAQSAYPPARWSPPCSSSWRCWRWPPEAPASPQVTDLPPRSCPMSPPVSMRFTARTQRDGWRSMGHGGCRVSASPCSERSSRRRAA